MSYAKCLTLSYKLGDVAMAAKAQVIHYRTWLGGTAKAACRRSLTAATTSPDPAKVNCGVCKALIKEAV